MYYRIANDDACKWCKSLQKSANHWRDIEFARHSNCRCIVINTRNNTIDSGTKKGVWNREYLSPQDFQDEINKSLSNALFKSNSNYKTPVLEPIPKASYAKIDKQLVQEMDNALHDINARYPIIIKHMNKELTSFKYSNIKNIKQNGAVKKTLYAKNGKINFEYNLKIVFEKGQDINVEAYANRWKEVFKQKGVSTPNTRHAMYHEAGHLLEDVITLNDSRFKGLIDDLKVTELIDNNFKKAEESFRKLFVEKNISKEIVNEVVDGYIKETQTSLTKRAIIKKNISTYANESESETFAELFAKVMNNDEDLITNLFKEALKKRGY